MVTCLLFWLDITIEKLKLGQPWPQILYIVVDGGSENRGVMFSMFVHTLIMYGFFKDVQLIYLPVGHSHYKCDQCFGVTGQFLKSVAYGCQTLSQLQQFLGDFEEGNSSVHYIEEFYDWTLIVDMLKEMCKDKELLKIAFEKKKGIKSWFNISMTSFTDLKTQKNNIIMNCYRKSIDGKDWHKLVNNPCLLFFNNKIKELKDYYTNKCGAFVSNLYQSVTNKVMDNNDKTSIIVEWPQMQQLENLSHTPMVPLKPLQFDKIREYINNFGLERQALDEWNELLAYFEKLEESSCLDCMFWYSQIKSKVFYAKVSKDLPENKKNLCKYTKALQKHLTQVNFHEKEYIDRNKRHKQHLFQMMRALKNKLQLKLNLEMTQAIDDDYANHLYIKPNELQNIILNNTQQIVIEKEIMQRCAMLTGTLQKSLEVLQLEKEFCNHLTSNIKKTYPNISQRIQLTFAKTVLKPNKINNKHHFTQSEIQSMINPQQFAIYDFPNYNDISHQIMILSNNNKESICEESWFLWYSLGTCKFGTRRRLLGTFLSPCGCYSLFDCWRLQESLKDNTRNNNLKWLNKCSNYYNHQSYHKMKTIVSKIQIVDLYDILKNDNEIKMYCLPLHLNVDFDVCRNITNQVLVNFHLKSVDSFQSVFANNVNAIGNNNYKSNFFNSTKDINQWFQRIFCHTEQPDIHQLPEHISLQFVQKSVL